jgi:hypothetical protein
MLGAACHADASAALVPALRDQLYAL